MVGIQQRGERKPCLVTCGDEARCPFSPRLARELDRYRKQKREPYSRLFAAGFEQPGPARKPGAGSLSAYLVREVVLEDAAGHGLAVDGICS